MSNAKSAIMVPIVTLAVCAIAMVGLGFALTTSVTSNTNTVEKLMIDLDSSFDTIGTQHVPDDTDVNSLFDYRITSEKSTTSTSTVIKYKLDSRASYLKIFSNVTSKQATLDVSGTGVSASGITEVVLGLYQVGSGGTIGSLVQQATIGSSTGGSFGTVSADTIYIVKVDKVTIDGIQYVCGNGITITETKGQTPSWNIQGSGTNSVSSFPKFDGTYASLGFTFTASAQPTDPVPSS